MYQAYLKIEKKDSDVSFIIDFGVYSRPSTAERQRKSLAALNPGYFFTLIYENYDRRKQEKTNENAPDCG